MYYRTLFIFLGLAATAVAQYSVTAPGTQIRVNAANDFATQAFQDPWDMQQRTDLGWYTYSVDQPLANLTGISIGNGLFSATTTTGGQARFWLLDTGHPGKGAIGKTGALYPIDSTKYRRLMFQMCMSGPGLKGPTDPTINPGQQSAQIYWSNQTFYQTGGPSVGSAFFTYSGCWVYSQDIPSLTQTGPAAWAAAPVDSLMVGFVELPNISVSMKWARLVSYNPALNMPITWTGSGAVDIFLADASHNVIGQIGYSVGGNSSSFYAGGLPAGTYTIGVRAAGSTGSMNFSSGAWVVDDIPTLTFTFPSPEGSADDFATYQLNDPWDMDYPDDIDQTFSINTLYNTNITPQDEAGNSLGSTRVLYGTSIQGPAGGAGDVEIYPLFFTKRGQTHRIDTSRYRILTLKQGVLADRDYNNGSIARLVWHVTGEFDGVGNALENVSKDILENSLKTTPVLQTIHLDMAALPIEPGTPVTSQSGWVGTVDSLRVKPHEFANATDFFYQSVKLASLEKAYGSYVFRWTYSNRGPTTPALSLYRATDRAGSNSVLIASGIDPNAGTYTWNTGGVPNGTYYIYGQLISGGTVLNQPLGYWPIVVANGSTAPANLFLNRSVLRYGVTGPNGSITTSGQDVQVTISGGSGPVSWTATPTLPWVTVTPSSGTGSGKFTVTINGAAIPIGGPYPAFINVTSPQIGNSPQTVTVYATAMSTTHAPTGIVDTPASNSSGLSGAFQIGGWAIDDIEITKVQVFRDRVPQDAPGSGLIYIGDAIFLPDTRPDVAATYPNNPWNYRAGWGMMFLSNMTLNNNGTSGVGGNGTFTLHVIATGKSGQQTEIGAPTITIDNVHARLPFGTIDTPAQGETINNPAYVNFAWALTPQPNTIPTDASTMFVSIDGANAGRPSYGYSRSDIQSLFPGFNNTNTAIGYFMINSTQMLNGIHSIAWSVRDNANNLQGIGSRVFYVTGGISPQSVTPVKAAAGVAPTAPRTEIALRSGWNFDAPLDTISLDRDGFHVELEQSGRVELHLGRPGLEGHLRFGKDRRPLPVGSQLDSENGIFYWHPPVAALGDFPLVFEDPAGEEPPIRVIVHIRTRQ